MSNDPKNDLIYAILAMDAYNRGYGSGIKNLSDNIGIKLGNFNVFDHTNNNVGSVDFNAGFYAIAYRNATTGETVISYRGTDVPVPWSSDTKGPSDIFSGYGLALGRTETDTNLTIGTEQIRLAAQFFDAVNAATTGVVRVTGHSLGGGLAANDNTPDWRIAA